MIDHLKVQEYSFLQSLRLSSLFAGWKISGFSLHFSISVRCADWGKPSPICKCFLQFHLAFLDFDVALADSASYFIFRNVKIMAQPSLPSFSIGHEVLYSNLLLLEWLSCFQRLPVLQVQKPPCLQSSPISNSNSSPVCLVFGFLPAAIFIFWFFSTACSHRNQGEFNVFWIGYGVLLWW